MRQRINWKFALRCVVSAVLFGWFFFAVGWEQVGLTLSRAQPHCIGAAILLIILAVIVSTLKWQCLLRGQELAVSAAEIYRIYWVGLFFNNLLPSSIGGDAVRMAMVGRKTGQPAAAASSVVVERIMATLALALIGFAASFFAAVRLPFIQEGFAALLMLSLLLIGLLLAGGEPRFSQRSEHRLSVLLRQFLAAGAHLRTKPRLLAGCLIWSIVFQLCNVAVNYALLQGLDLVQVGIWDVLAIVPATAVLSMIPLGVNGYGLREGGYVTLLAAYGVNSATAFAVSVLFAFLVSLCSLWGGLLWLRTDKGEKKIDSEDRGDCPNENACGV